MLVQLPVAAMQGVESVICTVLRSDLGQLKVPGVRGGARGRDCYQIQGVCWLNKLTG